MAVTWPPLKQRRVGGPNGAVVYLYRSERSKLARGNTHTGSRPDRDSVYIVRCCDRASLRGRELARFDNEAQASDLIDHLTPGTLAILRRSYRAA